MRHHLGRVDESLCRCFDRDQSRCTVHDARPNVCRRNRSGPRCGDDEFQRLGREQQGDDDYVPLSGA